MHITYRYPQQPAITFIVVSSFLVLAIYRYMPACVLCKHYAGGTCILHCALLCSTITTLGYHHTSSTSTGAAISSAFPFHCFTSLSSGPSTTFQMAFHGFHGKDQSNKKRDLLPLFTLHDFMFSEKKMKKVMKSIEDSFEYTQRSNEFEQIHNTPEKILNYADTIVAEIEKKERLLSKRKPKQLFFGDEDFIHTE